MRKLIGLFALLTLLGLQVGFAQTREITGTVIDKNDGSPLPGVSIRVKNNMTLGTATDVNGKFTLKVPENAVLIVTYIGMQTQEIVVTGKTNITIEMAPAAETLGEVVVVAYGTQTREAAVGSVGTVSASELKDIPTISVDNALQGKVAGVQVNSTTGQPGAATQIRIRGFSSVNAGMEPLYVIDGVPMTTGSGTSMLSTNNLLNSLNSKDIEQMTILKDASAAAIYGSRAANGVVLITTKKGREGKTRVNLSASYGFSKLANDNNYHPMGANDIYRYMRAAIVNSGFDPSTYSGLSGTPAGFFASENLPDNVKTVNWEDLAFRTAHVQDYQLSFSGGNEKTKFFVSGGYLNQEGIMVSSSFERYSIRANIDNKTNDWLSMGVGISGARTIQKDLANESMYYANPIWAAQNLLPWHVPYNEDGSFNFDLPSNANTNFLATAKYETQSEKNWRTDGNFYLQIEPIKNLKIRTQNAIELANGKSRRWWDPRAAMAGSETGTLQEYDTERVKYNTSNTISYSKIFNDVHNLRVLIGMEAEEYDSRVNYASGKDMGFKIPYLSGVPDDKSSVDFSWTRRTLVSYLGLAEYDYMSKYYLKVSVRRDGSSRFGSDTRWGTFWSVGASWNIHSEKFMRNLTWINFLKLRGSYGVSGNDAIGNYQQYGTYTGSVYNKFSGMVPENLANPKLGWETNKAYNIGLDFNLFGRIDASVEYYNRLTTDMLLNVPLSRTTGFSSIRKNIGELRNSGIEANLTVTVLDKPVIWKVFGNIGYNKVKMLDLGGVEEMSNGSFMKFKLGNGYSHYYVYDYAGVNPANGMAQWYDESGNITPYYSKARRVFRGQAEPKLVGGFGTEVSWKGLSLSANFEFKTGHYITLAESRYTRSDGSNWGCNQANTSLNYWKNPGDITDTPKPLISNSSGSNEWFTSRFLYKGNYVRFKNLTIAYSLPSHWVKKATLDQVRFYISGNNIYCWNDVPYYDPERTNMGTDYVPYPQSKTWTFGIEIGF